MHPYMLKFSTFPFPLYASILGIIRTIYNIE
jgi:hypothetical protein